MASLPYVVPVDLDVFKALTARLEQDGQTHNDVLRELLALDSVIEADDGGGPLESVAEVMAQSLNGGRFYSRGLMLPDGTDLRARYKGQEHRAIIHKGRWISEDGSEFDSPSAAASGVTSTNVNGLRFWEAKRPGDPGWRRLDVLRGNANS